MKLKSAFILAFCCLFTTAPLASAETLKAYSGPCPAGNPIGNWTVVITFNDEGQITRREGITCDGVHWVDHCPRVGIAGDPSQPSTYYSGLESGAWVRSNIDESGRITDMWGRDAKGNYWRSTSVTNPSGDLSEATR